MNLFDLFARLLEHAFAWCPRPIYVPLPKMLVRWTGERLPVARRGLCVWVPLFQEIEVIDLREQAAEFEPKVLWTKDGRDVGVGMVVVWQVEDAILTCTMVDDIDLFVVRVGESVLPELVGGFDMEELKRKAAGGSSHEWGFDTHLRQALRNKFKRYGLKIVSARLNFTTERVRTIKLVGSEPALGNMVQT